MGEEKKGNKTSILLCTACHTANAVVLLLDFKITYSYPSVHKRATE